jgi:branched-chain amino acid transport system permease protein
MASSPAFKLQQGSTGYLTYKWVGIALGVIALTLVAFAFNDTGKIELFDNGYTISLGRITKGISFIVAILGLQVVAGFTGQLSLGQGFFFGLGAYISAVLVADYNWSYFSTLIVVVPVCFLVGMAFGIPALRIKGLYLALVTLGLAALFPALVTLEWVAEYTNGAGGKSVTSKFVAPDWLPLDGVAAVLQGIPLVGDWFGDGDLSNSEASKIWLFILMVILTAVCFKLVSNMVKSKPGRALRAIRDNETSAAVSGMNLARYKTMSFGVASALGGVGGMIYVAETGIASPNDFTQLLSILFIVGLVVGGVGTLSGAVIGGLVIVFVPDWASSTQSLPGIPEKWLQGPTGNLILGVLLIVLTFVLPGGIVSGIRKLRAKVVVVLPRPPGRFEAESSVIEHAPVDPDPLPDDAVLDEPDPALSGTAEMSGTRSTE